MKRRLLNKNFLLLLQGKLVSNMGDVLYSVALSYWILKMTGSKTMMGSILALQTLVKVLLCPFGGVVSDRFSRKGMIVGSDFICGLALVTVSVLGLSGYLEVWMVMTAGVIMAMASSFFQPAVQAILPDLVEKEDLPKALSLNQTTVTLVQIVGQSLSGVLLSMFGPLMIFLGNGVSYFVSSFSEALIQAPKKTKVQTQLTFFEDFKSGLRFTMHDSAIRMMMFIFCILNFFGNGAFVMMLPYFMENTVMHGTTGYGIATALMTVGTLLGVILYGLLKLNGRQRYLCLTFSIVMMIVGAVVSVSAANLLWMIVGLMIFGFGNALLNIVFNEVEYEIIPDDKRGKVLGLISTLCMGLTPISMAAFSFCADIIGTYPMLCAGLLIASVGSLTVLFYKPIAAVVANKKVQI